MGKDDDKWTWDGASEEFEKFSDLVEAYFLEGNGGHIGHDLFMATRHVNRKFSDLLFFG